MNQKKEKLRKVKRIIMSKVKFNVVLGIWQWRNPMAKYGGILYTSRKWKTVEDILMLNEVQKYVRMVSKL